jgi:hypothetical protein
MLTSSTKTGARRGPRRVVHPARLRGACGTSQPALPVPYKPCQRARRRRHRLEKIEHADAVFAWVELNRDALLAHWRGDIDGAEMTLRTKPVPITGG